MAADGLGPAAQNGFEPVGQVFGFFGVRHQGHARGKFGLALDQGAAELQDFFQHAADRRRQITSRLERDWRFCITFRGTLGAALLGFEAVTATSSGPSTGPRVRSPGEVPGSSLIAADQLGPAVEFVLEGFGTGPEA